jgi:hypothetical protein
MIAVDVTDKTTVVLRLSSFFIWLGILAPIALAHLNLLHLSSRWNDTIEFICYILVGINNPVVSKWKERS